MNGERKAETYLALMQGETDWMSAGDERRFWLKIRNQAEVELGKHSHIGEILPTNDACGLTEPES